MLAKWKCLWYNSLAIGKIANIKHTFRLFSGRCQLLIRADFLEQQRDGGKTSGGKRNGSSINETAS
jgi:hypothetical protein